MFLTEVSFIPGQWSDWTAWPVCPCTTAPCDRSRTRLCEIPDGPCGEDCEGEETDSQPCCSASVPCGETEGDCDSDWDCAGHLVCGSDNCPQSPSISDCCMKDLEEHCKAVLLLHGSCCTPSSPCKLGGGDCDSDSDCEGSLTCGRDNCREFWTWAPATWDCCVRLDEHCQAVQSTDGSCCTSSSPCKGRLHLICKLLTSVHRVEVGEGVFRQTSPSEIIFQNPIKKF